jgi:hypothetical protein
MREYKLITPDLELHLKRRPDGILEGKATFPDAEYLITSTIRIEEGVKPDDDVKYGWV